MEACSYIYDEVVDISNYKITTHALSQYIIKCVTNVTLLEAIVIIRSKLKNVRKVELNKEKRQNRIAYMDEDENIYITDKNNIVTVFPNKRIFVAKTLYANKKTGYKYL